MNLEGETSQLERRQPGQRKGRLTSGAGKTLRSVGRAGSGVSLSSLVVLLEPCHMVINDVEDGLELLNAHSTSAVCADTLFQRFLDLLDHLDANPEAVVSVTVGCDTGAQGLDTPLQLSDLDLQVCCDVDFDLIHVLFEKAMNHTQTTNVRADTGAGLLQPFQCCVA